MFTKLQSTGLFRRFNVLFDIGVAHSENYVSAVVKNYILTTCISANIRLNTTN